MDMQALVREFHEKHGQPVSDTPTLTTPEAQAFRAKLMREFRPPDLAPILGVRGEE